MLSIYTFCVNFVQENTYLLASGDEAAIVDCGASSPEEWQRIAETVERMGVRVTQHWLTHGHFDHIFGTDFVYRTYGILPRMHEAEVPLYQGVNEQMRTIVGRDFGLSLPPVGVTFKEGDVLTLGDTHWEVIHTPGHTLGGVCFYCSAEGVLLCGDSLFRYSIGRTDLPGGDEATLVRALQEKVLTLPAEVVAYSGHGATTTIGEERAGNPYL